MSMYPMSLGEIADATGGRLVANGFDAEQVITSVVRDNREATAGSLFLCFTGERADGHDYANAAYQAGAICTICERELSGAKGAYIVVESTRDALRRLGAHYRAKLTIPIVGVTGSVGKTTAKEFVAAVLSERYNVLKTDENQNNEIGVPLTLLKISTAHTAAVIEMGISDFGEMTRLGEIARPDICVMTSIGHSHLEQLHDLDGVLRAKSEVFPHMPRDGIAVVCGDDERLRVFDAGLRKITYGFEAHNDFTAQSLEADGTRGIAFDIVSTDLSLRATIPAFGNHLALGALAAAAVGFELGLSPDEISRGLSAYAPVGSRSGVVETGHITIIDDCYNANPHSMEAALRSLAGLSGRRVALLGDMKELGDKSNELHRDIGLLAGELGINCLICCGERAEFIFKGFIASGARGESYHFPFRDALLRQLPSLITNGATVLVKASHSMRFEELVGELKKLS